MKILNLYAGVGGNRALWNQCDVTAIELDHHIGSVYAKLYPSDTLIRTDAHEYLLEHYKEFDIIWSSPPCQTHSRMENTRRGRNPRYPDMRLYEEILFLQYNFGGKWIVENVVPYYGPLFKPSAEIGRHVFWTNFDIGLVIEPEPFDNFIKAQDAGAKKRLQDWLGIHYDETLYYGNNKCNTQVLRNCVHPSIGLQILYYAMQALGSPIGMRLDPVSHANPVVLDNV